MSISGMTLGFVKGWSLALLMLVLCPILFIGITVFGTFASTKAIKSIRAYGQSAGYAEQALSSIKVVIAFGMELTERDTYS